MIMLDSDDDINSYCEAMNIKDNYQMSFNKLFKILKECQKRSLQVKMYEKQLKEYNNELCTKLHHIYLNPEIEMLRKTFFKEPHAYKRRKLLLIHFHIIKRSIMNYYPEVNTHLNEFMLFYNSIIKQEK